MVTFQCGSIYHNRKKKNKNLYCKVDDASQYKAFLERPRREILDNRLLELSSTLEPCRPATTYKLAIPGDVVRVMNQLKSDSHDFKEMNEKLSEEIKTLKKRKEQACEEKLVLKAEKAKMEQRVESMTNNLPPPVFMTPHPTAFQAAAIKMPFFPGYGYIPMCQYLKLLIITHPKLQGFYSN